MKHQAKTLIAGLVIASVSILLILFIFSFQKESSRMLFRDQILPSGSVMKVSSFNLVQRKENKNHKRSKACFALEYASSVSNAEPESKAREALEAFELIRPISEQWGLDTASISALQSSNRNGAYDKFVFKRSADGKWFYSRYPAKLQSVD